jgi:hypothetical protein
MSPLPLLTPAGANFLKDFPAQHAVDMDLIDAYTGQALTSHSLQTYTPLLEGTTGNPVLGTGGLIRGFYYRIFDQIYTWGEFRFGTAGIDVGSGIYTITLPFAANLVNGSSTGFDFSPIIGSGSTYDDSSNAGRLPLTVHLRGTDKMQFGLRTNSGSANRELRSAGYTTWAVSDGVTWAARYQRLS